MDKNAISMNDRTKPGIPNEKFASTGLDPTLELVLKRVRTRAKRRIAWLRKLWQEEGETGGHLAVTHAEIDSHIEDHDSPEAEAGWYESNKNVAGLNRDIIKIEEELASDSGSRLGRLRKAFGLFETESDLFQTCLAVSLDPSLARIYAYLHDHAGRGYATEHLAARLFGHDRCSLWNSESSLSRWDLIIEKETGPGEPTQLICDNAISHWLQGQNMLDSSLVDIATAYTPLKPLRNWPVEENVRFLADRFNGSNGCKVRMRIVGPPGSGRRTLAAIISSHLGHSLLAVETDAIDDHDWDRIFKRAQRYGHLNNCAMAWYGQKALNKRWPQAEQFYKLQFLICEPGQAPSQSPWIIERRIEVPPLSLKERTELWERFVPESANWSNEMFKKLVTHHQVTIGDIVSASKAGAKGAEETMEVVRERARHHLGDLAQLLECPFKWDDLVVSKNLKEALNDLDFEARERVVFWEREEAIRLFPQGRGLLALFSGPPGTGKTMAAQVIAADLELDLFRIDLSSVVSKYVGETSKNLERILSRAAGMDIVLLFDEADALFGKRTEIRDAHDRFANTETGYLLQAIENYRGVALLSTNRKGNIDPAFIRRIRYVLEFPKPDVKQREKIWNKIVGELAGGKRLNALKKDLITLAAALELTGSQIKFSVLTAIFIAKHDRKSLSIEHLIQGVDRELMKEGRALTGREREVLLDHGK